MAVPPIPGSPPPRDGDPLSRRYGPAGRHDLAGGRGTSVGRSPSARAGQAPASGTSPAGGQAVVTPDGRHVLAASLRMARDEASRLGSRIEQLAAARTALGQAQRLVERLGDVAVVAADQTTTAATRAVLQRQLERERAQIDGLAEGATLDGSLLTGGRAGESSVADEPASPVPFREIGSAALGLSRIAVRSADHALVATRFLDLAAARLRRIAASLDGMTGQLEAALTRVLAPATTATGDPALGDPTSALAAAIELRGALPESGDLAARLHAGLRPERVAPLLH